MSLGTKHETGTITARTVVFGFAVAFCGIGLASTAFGQQIYFTESSGNAIQICDASTGVVSPCVSTAPVGSFRPTGIDLDTANGRFFWTDFNSGLFSATLACTNPQLEVGGPFHSLQGVHVDPANGFVYWGPDHQFFSPSTNSGIRRSALNNVPGTTTIVRTNTVCFFPGGLEVDQAGTTAYWGDASCGIVKSANADGTGGISNLGFDGTVRDIALDEVNGVLYFTNGFGGEIRSMPIGGGATALVAGGFNFPWGLEIDVANQLLYFAEIFNNRISVHDLSNSTTQVLCSGLNGPQDLALERVIQVDIDIKPGSDPNGINPRSKGTIPVAILATDDFDPWDVDSSTLAFGPAGAAAAHSMAHAEDVDGDGDIDMVVHFNTQETGIACGDTEATLTGETFDGTAIEGTDSVKTAGCK